MNCVSNYSYCFDYFIHSFFYLFTPALMKRIRGIIKYFKSQPNFLQMRVKRDVLFAVLATQTYWTNEAIGEASAAAAAASTEAATTAAAAATPRRDASSSSTCRSYLHEAFSTDTCRACLAYVAVNIVAYFSNRCWQVNVAVLIQQHVCKM